MLMGMELELGHWVDRDDYVTGRVIAIKGDRVRVKWARGFGKEWLGLLDLVPLKGDLINCWALRS